MLMYSEVKNDSGLLQTLTSLSTDEFELFLPIFRETLVSYMGGMWEEEPPEGPGARPKLGCAENALFFILFYFKNYPLQKALGFFFGLSQNRASELIQDFAIVVRDALKKSGSLPERIACKLVTLIEDEDQTYSIDGTERRVERSKDEEKQKNDYSGKKKAHTRLNLLISGNNDMKVKYLGATYAGSTSEVKIAKEEDACFPDGTDLYQDKGLQGYSPNGVIIHQPKKKPPGGELTEEEKKTNSLISGVRIAVEHVISGVKRLHIVKQVFRNKVDGFDDIVMEIACGLHNFRCDCRRQY